jgi:hypothetical protein
MDITLSDLEIILQDRPSSSYSITLFVDKLTMSEHLIKKSGRVIDDKFMNLLLV